MNGIDQASNTDFATLRKSGPANDSMFQDPDFPIYKFSLKFSQLADPEIKIEEIEWLRPGDIVKDPKFFVDGYSRFDVNQGRLGDCWLLAAVANLSLDAKLFFRVVPPDQDFQESYAGIFHFNFWQYGKWVEVVIDDRLPTLNKELIHMFSSEKNEFWSALLEKAYAKLRGSYSYEALEGGYFCEAIEDLTGGVTEEYVTKKAPPNIFSIMSRAADSGSMMSGSLKCDPNVLEAKTSDGLIRGHVYSITKVCLMDIPASNCQGKLPMIRLRNPWGYEAEWIGPWSDSSSEWLNIPEHQKEEIGLKFDSDGEFWMSFPDFLNHFDYVHICHMSPNSLPEEQEHNSRNRWKMSMFEGEWTVGVTAGGCINFKETFWHNPQYIISLKDPDEGDDDGMCTVIVALMQKNRRSKQNVDIGNLRIGFTIYHLTDEDLQVKQVAISPFMCLREVCERFKLPPGRYLIIPSTFDPNQKGEFIIRVLSETMSNMEENDDKVDFGGRNDRIEPTPKERDDPQINELRRLFNNFPSRDKNAYLQDLKRILDDSMRNVVGGSEGFSKDTVSSMMAMLDKDCSACLDDDETEALLTDLAKCRAVFKLYDPQCTGSIDGFHLREALNSAGYNLSYASREGKVSFDDFLVRAIKVRTFIDMFWE